MKIRAIRLQNVRRFVDPVEITGIGPGLNVLSAPNEQGKSTIFDALHALFFKDAKSWDRDIRALVPHAGGDPRVEVDIDHQNARYRIAKHFFKTAGKGEVRIWREDRLLHQADAAEQWLRALIKPPKDGGPSGLLWVRQGLTAFEDAKDTEQARRDLLSSVAGEVDMVTGGQRMDAICRKVQASLDQVVTKRGAKKGGALDLAEREVAELQDKRNQLSDQVSELRQLLEARRSLRAEQAELDDPEERAALAARLETAEVALAAAQRHQDQLAQASRAVKLAETLLENHRRKMETLSQQLDECAQARQEEEAAIAEAELLAKELKAPKDRMQTLTDLLAAARAKVKVERQTLERVQMAYAAAQAKDLRRDLTMRLEKAKVQVKVLEDLAGAASAGPDADMMRGLEAAQMAFGVALRAQERAATALTVHYEEGAEATVSLDGAAVSGGVRLALPEGGQLCVPGVAVIDIHPGEAIGADAVQQAGAERAQALERSGCTSIEEARAAFDSRQSARQQRQEAETVLSVLAPEGVEALQRQLEALPQGLSLEEEGASTDTLDRAAAEAACRVAEEEVDRLSAELEGVRGVAEARRLAAEMARSRAEASRQRVERSQAAIGGEAESKASLDRLAAQLPDLQQELSQTQATEAALRRAAPDLAQAEVAAKRARSAQQIARQRSQDLVRDLAVLDARISAHASAAVEEELAETVDQLMRAQGRLATVAFEVAVQRRLLAALEAARAQAQEHYVGPILGELLPLLRMLWPEARLRVDADQILPEDLERGGEAIGFESLSGGTQEQIALLVRLAFARLLAKAGTPAPLILDDAIVYTDDARIEKIFDALTLQADDLQMLVFTCRQKAFRSLGGTPLSIRPAQAAD